MKARRLFDIALALSSLGVGAAIVRHGLASASRPDTGNPFEILDGVFRVLAYGALMLCAVLAVASIVSLIVGLREDELTRRSARTAPPRAVARPRSPAPPDRCTPR